MPEYSIASTWDGLARSDSDLMIGNDLNTLIDDSTEFFTRGTSSVASVWVTMSDTDTLTPVWEAPRYPDHTPVTANGYYVLEIREEGPPTNRVKGRARRFVHARGHVNPRALRDAEVAIAAVQSAQRALRSALADWARVRTALPEDMQERMQERIDD